MTVTVNRTRRSARRRCRSLSADASATGAAFTDYKALDQTYLFFKPGELTKTVEVSIRADAIAEPAETFTLALASPNGGNATIGTPSSAIGQIQDDDTAAVPSTTLTALTTTDSLVTFSTAAPATVSAPLAITGLAAGEHLVGMDRRPANGRLYAISDQSRLYLLDEGSGAATAIGAQFAPPLTGDAWGFDFSPTADFARIVARLTRPEPAHQPGHGRGHRRRAARLRRRGPVRRSARQRRRAGLHEQRAGRHEHHAVRLQLHSRT